jgi:hypothetical protein
VVCIDPKQDPLKPVSKIAASIFVINGQYGSCLFFIMGPWYVNVLQLVMGIAGYTIYEHVITQQLISDMESPISTSSLSSRNRCLACVHVTKQRSSEVWHIALTHDSS